MSKQSLGIILSGRLELQQKRSLVLKIIDKIFLYAWIPLCIIAVVMFLTAIGQDSYNLLRISICCLLWGVLFFLIFCIWGTYGRCPFCGHFFTLKRIGGDKLVYQHDRHVTRRENTYHSGVAFDNYGDSAFYVGKSTRKVNGTDTTKELTFNSRCTCCHAVVKIKRFSFERK